ncbi:MAG TPA: hypothetical protein IGR64_07695 [Leptolyngbyaceae cyanobacterium M65_K2018_010]|nr:hypothetical protein [Leptolyngbyaceae cyanobacterium M65_K2018_010]
MLPDESHSSPDIQQEIRRDRPFSLADVIGQEAGNFMQGESPVPRLVQARGEATQYLKEHLEDLPGALQQVLQQWIEADEARMSRHLDTPVNALKELLETVLQSPETLYELVRQADMTWGRLYDERPYFQQPGQDPHPQDEYTHESVRATLTVCLQRLNGGDTDGAVGPGRKG